MLELTNDAVDCFGLWQIENDIEADTVFDSSKPSARRSSASTNNNNPSPVEPGCPKTVRSR